MKHDNNENQNNGTSKANQQQTLVDAARLSLGNIGLFPRSGEPMTRESLVSIIQRTLELVEGELDDWEDDFPTANSYGNNNNHTNWRPFHDGQ